MNRITAQEINVDGSGFGAIVQTKCPKDDITEEMIAWVAKHANLRAGDGITVQSMNHYHSHVFHICHYTVTGCEEVTQAPDGFDQPNQITKQIWTVWCDRPWIATPFGKALAESKKKDEAA